MHTLNEIAFSQLMFCGNLIVLLLSIAVVVYFGIYQKEILGNPIVLKQIKNFCQRKLLAAILAAEELEEASVVKSINQDINASLATIGKLINKIPLHDEESHNMVADAKNALSNTLQNIQNLSASPYRSISAKSGLADALHNLVSILSDASSLIIYFASDGASSLSIAQELTIYRTVQELANNIFKQQDAHNLNIELKEQNGTLLLLVND